MSKSNRRYDILRPPPDSFLQSARSFGYTIEAAIADIIDNSITAKSSKIDISYGIDQYSSFVRIEDNGNGMSEKQLINAMKLGSFNPLDTRKPNDLGRFGLGLKTASFSQCLRLTVKTRKNAENHIRCWDLDVVSEEKDWVLLREPADKRSEKRLGDFSQSDSGTIVLWEKLDRLVDASDFREDKEHFYRKFENVKKHLGLIFHRFIEENEICITVNKESIDASNPFQVSSKIPSTELQEETLSIRRQKIIIQPYILPHESKLSKDEFIQLQLIKGWTEHQGIYLYRNKRLISDGNWLDLDFRKKESQRLCRISIDIPNTLDKEWQIDVKKSTAKIPDAIRKPVKNICFAALEKAIKVYTHRGAYVRRASGKKEITYLWLAKSKHGKRSYQINNKHPIYQLITDHLSKDAYIFQDYLRLIGESLPVSLIVNDFSDPSTRIKDFFEDSKAELTIIYQNTLKALIAAGMTKEVALEKVSKIECFQHINQNI